MSQKNTIMCTKIGGGKDVKSNSYSRHFSWKANQQIIKCLACLTKQIKLKNQRRKKRSAHIPSLDYTESTAKRTCLSWFVSKSRLRNYSRIWKSTSIRSLQSSMDTRFSPSFSGTCQCLFSLKIGWNNMKKKKKISRSKKSLR